MQRLIVLFSVFIIACGGGSGNKPDAHPPVTTPDAWQAPIDAGNQQDTIQPATGIDSGQQTPIDGGGVAACKVVEPCGGDPTGVWSLTSMCYPGFADELTKEFGADEVARCKMSIGFQITGMLTFTFTSDGRFFQDEDGDGYQTISMTDECLRTKYSQFSKGANCTSSNGISICEIGGSGSESDAGAEDAGGSSTSGRYSFSGTTITTIDHGTFEYDWEYAAGGILLKGNNQRYDKEPKHIGYCVQGNTFSISEDGFSATFVKVAPTNSSLPFNPQTPKLESPTAVPAPTSVGSSYAEAIPCGGNLIGTWNVTGITIDDELQQQIISKVRSFDPDGECAYKIDVADKGSATFGELNLYTGRCSGVSEQPSLTISYSSACLPKGKTCEELIAPRQAEAAIYDAQTTVVCAPLANGDCACTHSRKYTQNSCEYYAVLGMNHTYSIGTEGSDYSKFWADSYGVPYCISGNTLQAYSRSFGIYGLEGKATITAARSGTVATQATDNPGTVAACPAVTKCSGSLVGTWDITAACVASDKASSLKYTFSEYGLSNISGCVDSADAKGTGKAEFASDGTFNISLALNINPSFKMDCLQAQKISCGPVLQERLSFAYPGIICATGVTGTCDCTYVQRFPNIGSSTSSANYYGGLQTLKPKTDGTFELVSTYTDDEVTADFSSKLEDPVGTSFGFVDVRMKDAGIYGCAKGNTLTMYTGQLIEGLYLNIAGQRVK